VLSGRRATARVEAEPVATADIVARCAGLPLALTLVAARAAAHPGFPLAALAAELTSGGEGLAVFDTADPATDVRHVFSWSYRECGADAARLFRYLGLHPGPDITVAAAASLAGVSESAAKRLLADLARAHLVAEHVPGRFTCHDLLRAYAGELARTIDTDADRRAAMHRTLDHYLRTVYTGSMLLNPHRDPITPVAAHDGVTPEDLPDAKQALAWFSAEHAVLLRAVELAATNGFEVHTWQLAWSLTNFLQRLGHWDDQIATQNAALASARRFGDHIGQANAHRHLGRAHGFLGRHDEATTHLGMSLDLFGRLGDGVNQAHLHLDLGMTCDRRADHAGALDHARRACELFRAAGHRSGQANALNAVGWEYAQMGDYEQAMKHCLEALVLQQEVGDRHAQAGTWDSIAYAHRRLGDNGLAVECYQEALALYREESDRFYQAEILSHLGDAHDAAGERGLALDAWAQALALMEELGHQDTERVRAKLS
jgi:tetratricopeptide (TPR) repeat protein